jgi:DNA-binding transcriptional regulator YiaG
MPQHAPAVGLSEIRRLRLKVQLSQPQFARLLGVSAETYRTWDSGRRAMPEGWLTRARELAAAKDPRRLRSLQQLAAELGVHVRTLRDAARSGRLDVTYGNHVVFGNAVPRATLAAGRTFMDRYYKQSYSRFAPKPRPPERTAVPSDWTRQLLRVRRELRLTQARLAEQIGAAGKAVVYQWESRKRKPSSVLWKRVERLIDAASTEPSSPTPGRDS